MLCEQLESDVPFKIRSKTNLYFSLHNVALDLKSQVTIWSILGSRTFSYLGE